MILASPGNGIDLRIGQNSWYQEPVTNNHCTVRLDDPTFIDTDPSLAGSDVVLHGVEIYSDQYEVHDNSIELVISRSDGSVGSNTIQVSDASGPVSPNGTTREAAEVKVIMQ